MNAARLRKLARTGSPWVLDVGLAAAFLVGGQIEASIRTIDGYTGGSPLVSHVVAACVAIPLAFRRTAPLACLLAVCAGLLVPSLFWAHDLYFWSELLPTTFAVYPVARLVDGPLGRWSWLLAFVALDSEMLHAPGSRQWGNVTFLLLMLGVTTLAGRLVRRGVVTRHRLTEALARLDLEHQAAERAAVDVERNRIAGEVHDVVAHAVGSMLVQVGAARLGLEQAGARVPLQLRAAEDTGRRALAELRGSVGVLDAGTGPAPLEPLPDLGHLPDLVRGFRSAGLDVRLSADETADLPAGLQLTGYRILQESLTNVLRHAGRVPVLARVERLADQLVIEVSNPLGRTPQHRLPSGGHGLVGMRQRAAMFEGSVDTRAEDGRFVVRARLQVPTAADLPAGVTSWAVS